MDLFENLDRIFISKGEGSFEEWPLLLACLTFYLALRLLMKAYEKQLDLAEQRTGVWIKKENHRLKRRAAREIRRAILRMQERKEKRDDERKHQTENHEGICGHS